MCSLQEFDLLFDLPGEIREQILGYLLIKPYGILISGNPSLSRPLFGIPDSANEDSGNEAEDTDETDGARWPLNYFLVSQTFHREATAVYFRENTFLITTTGKRVLFKNSDNELMSRFAPLHVAAPRSGDALLANPAWALSRRRIRNAVVYIQRPRGFLEESVFQPLLDMILAGGLKELEFRLGFQARGETLFASIPMRCMYRVLTDPDLIVAKLSIPARNHGSAWCVFHERRGHYSSCANSPGKLNGPGSGLWTNVDVTALIRKYGEVEDQLRILKVGD